MLNEGLVQLLKLYEDSASSVTSGNEDFFSWLSFKTVSTVTISFFSFRAVHQGQRRLAPTSQRKSTKVKNGQPESKDSQRGPTYKFKEPIILTDMY